MTHNLQIELRKNGERMLVTSWKEAEAFLLQGWTYLRVLVTHFKGKTS